MIRCLLFLTTCIWVSPAMAERPNFVILIADGIGRDWISSYGAGHKTPHIDALASEGILFTVAWGSPAKASTRATLESGQYPFRHKIMSEDDLLPDRDIPVRTAFKGTDYVGVYLSRTGGIKTIEEVLTKLENQFPFIVYYELIPETVPATVEGFRKYVTTVDNEVGAINALLERQELSENTIVIFTSSSASRISGEFNGETYPNSSGVNANWSAHVPLLVKAPEIIPEPHSRRDLIDASDLFPTVLELADVPVPDNHPIDGKSFVPVLRGSDDPFEKRNWIYAQSGNFRMMRDWHHYIDDSGAFHDLDKDPFQREEVSVQDKQAPHRRERLQMILDRFPKAGN